MERAAVPYFGMKAYGVHINGYVKDPITSEILLWVAKRSKTKSTFPGICLRIVFLSFNYLKDYFTYFQFLSFMLNSNSLLLSCLLFHNIRLPIIGYYDIMYALHPIPFSLLHYLHVEICCPDKPHSFFYPF